MFPHSSYTVLLGGTTPGGLVDGPIDTKRNKAQIGIVLLKPDEYAAFNNGKAVYHDDIGDYSTNEPTMDGTASLSFYLASLENAGRNQSQKIKFEKDGEGAIIRINPEEKDIYLTFTADELFEGGVRVLQTLQKHKIKGSFFFTGNFLRNPEFREITQKIISYGHYVGAHSDKHLLYCDWQKRDSLLVDFKAFETDIKNNFAELEKFGIQKENARYFMSPYEWYNRQIVDWSRNLGLDMVCFTPGTGTNADYTTPEMKNYKSSEQIFTNLLNFENKENLNGSILLIHPGTEDARTDKFDLKLGELIETLLKDGYRFKSF